MKSSVKRTHYISAYPLKALNLPEQEYQSAIHISSASTGKPANRFRVTAMIDPYRAVNEEPESVKPAVENDQHGPVCFKPFK